MRFHTGDFAPFYKIGHFDAEEVQYFFNRDVQGFYFSGVEQNLSVLGGREFAFGFEGDGAGFVKAAFLFSGGRSGWRRTGR
jgi:hypothetical protein